MRLYYKQYPGQELITTEFKHGTWFLGISEVVKVAGRITESGTGQKLFSESP